MTIAVKRAYEPRRRGDGLRLLVDRLWPRGLKKENAHIDVWAKELAPSTELRKWFHEDPEKRYVLFKAKYMRELKKEKHRALDLIKGEKRVTLITAAKDIDRSHVTVLRTFLSSIKG